MKNLILILLLTMAFSCETQEIITDDAQVIQSELQLSKEMGKSHVRCDNVHHGCCYEEVVIGDDGTCTQYNKCTGNTHIIPCPPGPKQ